MNTQFTTYEAWLGTLGRFIDQGRQAPAFGDPTATNGHAHKPRALPAATNGNGNGKHTTPKQAKIAAANAASKPVKKAPVKKAPAPAVAPGQFGAKAAFIRSMPDAKANDVVEAAAKKGLSITAAHVYNVRAEEKKKSGTTAAPKKAKAAPAAKPAPAPKKAKAAKPAPAAKGSHGAKIAASRQAVLRGERPKNVEAVAIVMGTKTMNSEQIEAALKERGWLPQSSNVRNTISYIMSDNADVFERVERGLYKVKDPKHYATVARQFARGQSSGKAERVASTNSEQAADETVEEAPASEQTTAEAKPEASDPPESTEVSADGNGDQAQTSEFDVDSLGATDPFGD